MNATIMTTAKLAAIKAIKRDLQAQGLKPVHIERHIIVSVADTYLREHPELLEEAAEIVRKVPQLRTLAERAGANAGETSDERDHANDSKPNTAPFAQCGLQTKRVSDRGKSLAIDPDRA